MNSPTPNISLKETVRTSSKVGGALNGASYALQFLVTIFLTPFVLRYVGKEGYGVWVLVSALGGNYGLINLGISSALVRHVALYTAAGNGAKARQVSATALVFLTFTGLLVFIFTWLAARSMVGWLGVDESHADSFEWLIRMSGLAVAVDFTAVVFSTALNARERFKETGTRKLALIFIRGGFTVAVLMLGMGLNGLGVTAVAMSALSLVINITQVRSLLGRDAVIFKGASFSILVELIRFGISTLLMQVVDLARMRLGPLLLIKTSGAGAVAAFGLASSLVTQFNSMVGTVVSVLSPKVARLDGQSAREELRAVFSKSLFFCSTVSCAFMLMIYFFGPRFLLLWVGPEFQSAVPVLQLLSLAYGLAAAQSSGWSVMFGLGKHHFMAVVSLVEIAIIGAGGWALIPNYGAVGMALAVCLAVTLTKILVQPLYLSKIVGISLWTYIQPLAGPFCAAGVLGIAGTIVGLPSILADTSLVSWGLMAVGVAALYAGFVLLLTWRRAFFVNPLPRRVMARLKSLTPLRKS